MINKVHCADCLEFMKQIPDNSIDLVITDPPYWDGVGYGRNNKEIVNNEDESINYLIIPELYKKLKDNTNMYIFTNWKFMDKIRGFIEDKTNFTVRMVLIIYKNNIGMGYGFRNQYEVCIVAEKWKPKYRLNDFSNVIKMEHIEHSEFSHPHEKWLEMLKKMITHSIDDGIILDCFAGSWSTLVAAKQLHKNYIGIELDEKYTKLCNKRLNHTTTSLF